MGAVSTPRAYSPEPVGTCSPNTRCLRQRGNASAPRLTLKCVFHTPLSLSLFISATLTQLYKGDLWAEGGGVGLCGQAAGPWSPGLWLWLTALPCPPPGFDSTGPTCVDIMVSVQGSELLAVVPGEGVTSVAMVAPQPQLVILALRLQAEAGIFCKDLAARPVLHGHQQFVVALVCQPVNVLQAQPVFAINVPKPLLGKTWESVSEEHAAFLASRAQLPDAHSALGRGARIQIPALPGCDLMSHAPC